MTHYVGITKDHVIIKVIQFAMSCGIPLRALQINYAANREGSFVTRKMAIVTIFLLFSMVYCALGGKCDISTFI